MKVADLEDLPEIVDMSMKFLNTTGYKPHVDKEIVRDLVSSLIVGLKTEKIIIFESGVGFLAGCVTPFLFGPHLLATEIGWWVEPEARGKGAGKEFLAAFEYWAKEKAGCTLISMVSLDDEIGKAYEKQGYKLYERAYMKEL